MSCLIKVRKITNSFLWLSDKHIKYIQEIADRYYPLETGGIILGYVADNKDYVVTHLIGPGDNSKHFKYSFIPDHVFHQECIDKIFTETNGESDYLGDWHTHPVGNCNMSLRDKFTLRKISNSNINIKPPLMMIFSKKNTWVGSVWTFKRAGVLNILSLRKILIEEF